MDLDEATGEIARLRKRLVDVRRECAEIAEGLAYDHGFYDTPAQVALTIAKKIRRIRLGLLDGTRHQD